MCFDDAQLERVCEYPSEACELASLPCYPGPEDGGREEGWRGGEQEAEGQEEDEEDESAAFVSRSAMNESTGRVRFLKVGQWLLNYIKIKTSKHGIKKLQIQIHE